MKTPPLPADEPERLEALTRLRILDTEREERYERIVRLVAGYFRVPIALVSLVDANRQWFKAAHGLDVRETPREVSFCGHAILGEEALIIPDATADDRFCDNPLVTSDPDIRFYAGQPIVTFDGHRIGTLCIIDRKPRTLTTQETAALLDFARLVENEIQHARTHQALDRLRENDTHRAAILETALDSIVTIDSTGHILEFNPAAERMFGMRWADVLGKELASILIPPRMRELHRGGMRHYLATGHGPVLGKRIEVPAMRGDGSEFPAEIAITATQVGGQPAFTAFMRDLTGPRQARRNQEAQHSVSLVLAEEANPEVALRRILETACETLGWAVGELWGIDEHAGELTRDHWWRAPGVHVDDFIAEGRRLRFGRGVGLPGRVWETGASVWVRDLTQDPGIVRKGPASSAGLRAAIGVPIQSGNRPLGVMTFFGAAIREPEAELLDLLGTIGQQIGQYLVRRNAEARIKVLTTELNAIFSLSPDGYFAFDRNGVASLFNPALLRMLGLESRDVEGIREPEFDRLLRERCAPSRHDAGHFRASAPDGVLRLALPRPATLMRTARLLQTAEGEPLGKVIHFRDITHEAEVDRMKTEFLAAAAHELRTPMASIFGFSELLLNRSFDEPTRRELTQTIHRQSQHLISLVTELLDLSRIEAREGKDFQIHAQPLQPIVRDTLKGLFVRDDTRKVAVKLPRKDLEVLVDAEKLKQALVNVLSNAYKYSPNGGEIALTVRNRRDGNQAFAGIAVRDHGIGMNPEQVDRMFERFYRADNSGSIPGTGLGMSLTKEIIDLHRGRIDVTSAIGEGTEVVLWVPLATAAAP